MPQPSESIAPSAGDDSLFDLLVEALDNLEEGVRAAFLQQFFKSVARIDLTHAQSLDYWTKILARRKELSELLHTRVALKTAIVDILASTAFLRVPILMEYEEFKKLQLNAATDALTGLYNRRLFEEYCDKELNRAKRYGHQLALVLLDLHRLKELNDRYGHLQGDQALQLAAATLRKNLRASDFAFRIGGDEFALLLPQADPEQAATLCDRLRAHFEGEIAPINLSVPVTVDYGIAVHPHDGDTKESLMRVADQRLYQMKNAAHARTRGPEQKPPEPPQPSQESVPPATQAPRPQATPGKETKPYSERRKWERVSLSGTRAYAALAGNEKKTANVVDLCTGGLSLHVENAEELSSSFVAVLHVPILPPLRVTLRKVYTRKVDGMTRIGCAFAT